VHDLDKILAEVRTWLPGLGPITVSWVKPGAAKLANFNAKDDWASCVHGRGMSWIGLSPRLKRAPGYVLKYLIGHEVLHVSLPPRGTVAHHRAFRVAEGLLPKARQAMAWLDAHA
jgi:predicted metal-dependent hydrolase